MKKAWNRFINGLFTKAQFLTGASIVALSLSAVVYAVQSLNLNVFTSGTPISSSAVNDNFQQISDSIRQMNNRFQVTLTTPLTITSTYSSLPFQFDSTSYDLTPHSYSQSLMATNFFVVQEPGVYQYTLVGLATPAMCCSDLILKVNGSYLTQVALTSGTPHVSRAYSYLNSGNTVSFEYYEGSDVEIQPSVTKFIFEKID